MAYVHKSAPFVRSRGRERAKGRGPKRNEREDAAHLDGAVGDAAALADVERLQVVQRVGQTDQALVRDVARRQRQLLQVDQALRHVHHRLVVDFVAERHVQRGDARTALHPQKKNTHKTRSISMKHHPTLGCVSCYLMSSLFFWLVTFHELPNHHLGVGSI